MSRVPPPRSTRQRARARTNFKWPNVSRSTAADGRRRLTVIGDARELLPGRCLAWHHPVAQRLTQLLAPEHERRHLAPRERRGGHALERHGVHPLAAVLHAVVEVRRGG